MREHREFPNGWREPKLKQRASRRARYSINMATRFPRPYEIFAVKHAGSNDVLISLFTDNHDIEVYDDNEMLIWFAYAINGNPPENWQAGELFVDPRTFRPATRAEVEKFLDFVKAESGTTVLLGKNPQKMFDKVLPDTYPRFF